MGEEAGGAAVIEPLWLSVARMAHALAEIPGRLSNPVVLQWARDIGAPDWYDNDDKPWCALFLNRVLKACQLPMAGTGFDLLRARSFAVWGQRLDAPALGSILVFTRPEGAHVGFYLGEHAAAFRVYGGNQANQVGEAWIARDRLQAIRWPADHPLPVSAPVRLAADGRSMSGNEA